MADSVLVQSKVKAELKEQAEIIFNNAGLGMGDAIRLFLQQSVNAGDIPFAVTARKPSAHLQKALEQSERGEVTAYPTLDAMKADRRKRAHA